MNKVFLTNTYGYSDFISSKDKNIFINWINNNRHLFKSNEASNYREYVILGDDVDYPKNIVNNLRNKIIKLENIIDYKLEPLLKNYIGINSKGARIHLHTDPNEGNYIHTRYNIMLSMPEGGGDSIYGGQLNKLHENLIWKCIAGKISHESTEVLGDKPRITLSLGFLINSISNPHLFTELKKNII